jgi:threonyl-tRNA synthetase
MLEKGHMNKKIKIAQKEQIPFMLIVGEREMEEGTVALRRRGTREQVTMGFDEFLTMAIDLAQSRSRELE